MVMNASSPRVAIIIPAYNAAAHLPAVLDAAGVNGADEILVVDAGSTDATAAIARQHGVRLIQLPERVGPAAARNHGVRQTTAEVLLFLDADCRPHEDVVSRVRTAFATDPRLVSLTGSYDGAPPDPGFFSQYMNLRHHATHQLARRHDATFWAGCGAVRRDTFRRAGGFDAVRYPTPQIEDIELGLRLAPLGAMALDPNLQVTHLKRWTAGSVITTDIRQRALPWSRLLLAGAKMPDDLNLRWSQRLAAALAPLVLLALLAAPIATLAGAWGFLLPIAILVALSLALSWDLVRCFGRQRSWPFALGAWLFHQVHLLYSAGTYGLCWGLRLGRRKLRSQHTP